MEEKKKHEEPKGKDKKTDQSLPVEDQSSTVISNNEINPEEVHQIIERLPEKDKRILEAVIMESRYSGPLPPPEFISGYKAVLSDAPERIMSMAEKEQSHRHGIESSLANNHNKQNSRGQIFGFILVLFFGIIGLILGLRNHDSLAKIIVTTTIIGVAIVFVLHRIPFTKKTVSEDSSEAKKMIEA